MLKSNNIKDTENIKEWAEFLPRPNLYYADFNLVRKEIEYKTNRLARTNKDISFNSILLKIHTNRYDLTFVDLPGLTKVPVGDQPPDIDIQIQNLIMSYVNKLFNKRKPSNSEKNRPRRHQNNSSSYKIGPN